MRISTGLLSAMLAGAVGFAGSPRPAHSADWLELLGISPVATTSPLVISVEAVYPGASAQVVADTVAAPIEQQVNGVEKMRYMRSRCSNDGTYTLHVTFAADDDANMMQVLVQNRVALALPVLPDAVQQRGITVKKKSPGAIMIVILRSPDGSRNVRDLSIEAIARLKDELVRLPGIADVTCLGCIDCGARVKLNPEKMAAHNLTAGDVVAALQQQNAQAAAGQTGQPATPPREGPQITITGPLYEWNNTLNGKNLFPEVHRGGTSPCSETDHIRAGRDYFVNTPRPGYKPYTYPHPLVTGKPSTL